jgi:hypothetical protein
VPKQKPTGATTKTGTRQKAKKACQSMSKSVKLFTFCLSVQAVKVCLCVVVASGGGRRGCCVYGRIKTSEKM